MFFLSAKCVKRRHKKAPFSGGFTSADYFMRYTAMKIANANTRTAIASTS
jgi:hypothetical protein